LPQTFGEAVAPTFPPTGSATLYDTKSYLT